MIIESIGLNDHVYLYVLDKSGAFPSRRHVFRYHSLEDPQPAMTVEGENSPATPCMYLKQNN